MKIMLIKNISEGFDPYAYISFPQKIELKDLHWHARHSHPIEQTCKLDYELALQDYRDGKISIYDIEFLFRTDYCKSDELTRFYYSIERRMRKIPEFGDLTELLEIIKSTRKLPLRYWMPE